MLGSALGGESLSIWLSIVLSAVEWGLDPFDYICDVYCKMQGLPKDMTEDEKIEKAMQWLPDRYKPEKYNPILGEPATQKQIDRHERKERRKRGALKHKRTGTGA